jgi:hypothetical protein
MKKLLLTGIAALFLVMSAPANATFFPGPSGSCCNQFGGGSYLGPSRPLTPRYIACLRANRAKYLAMFNNATIAIRNCRGVR